jgi:hypothetical protein
MKRLLMVLPLLFVVGEAGAVERHNVSQMTCEAVQSTLQTGGKAILQTPSTRVPGMMRYDMYASNRYACGAPPAGGVRASVNTSDGPCHVYRCQQIARPHAY